MRLIIPTELKRKLSKNKFALRSFMRSSKRVKEDFIDYVISGSTSTSRQCRADRAVRALSGSRYSSLTPC